MKKNKMDNFASVSQEIPLQNHETLENKAQIIQIGKPEN